MPIEKPTDSTAPVFYPTEDLEIVKYFDLSKFLYLIQTQTLFFCRLDKFEDQFEGSFPELSKKQYRDWFLDLTNSGSDFRKDELDYFLNDRIGISESFKKLNCISCWNKSSSESYALWKIYSDMNKGIMIKSSTSNLIKALEKTPENIQLSEIKYIDYRKEEIPIGNLNYSVIHKHNAYNYEQEIRLIHQVRPQNGYKYNWEKEKNPFGKYMKIELESLISEIVVSPYAPKWFFEIIQNLLTTYKLDKPINYSVLKI